ncbi:proliferation-associated protein 1 [Auriscalpium vulgare]|uniref:Proliferation-associated protein 1 n=1 Tax=Auriscalpium vulgare TaxID=40419 RepID=A0ACB8RIN2_9AGAM|nr:proliferation-associated protein 1 [Auriscalpium vulgare]
MFMTSLCDGLTMYKPKHAPSNILALGSGFRTWSVEAAQAWPKCNIIGHSVLYDCPDFSSLFKSKHVDGRVTFHTRDIVSGLDYPDDTFDLVRVSYCSLSLAEKEWHIIIKEIHRVLKPGGVLEVTEDDLIFPGVRESDLHSPPPSPLMLQPKSSASLLAPLPKERRSSFLRLHRDNSVDPAALSSATLSSSYGGEKSSSQDVFTSSREPPPRLDMTFDPIAPEHPLDPLDHSRLWHAWHEMLSMRSISPQPTSVLPLYLSMFFDDFRALPALDIFMPASSTASTRSSPRSSKEDVKSSRSSRTRSGQMIDPAPYRQLGRPTVKEEVDANSVLSGNSPAHFISAWAPMHLARTVAAIRCCKEAIWEAYDRLYGNGPTITPVAGRDRDPKQPVKGTARDEFEVVWFNWESDMLSRVNMRETVSSTLQWSEPATEAPDLRIWRDSLWAQGTSATSPLLDTGRQSTGIDSLSPNNSHYQRFDRNCIVSSCFLSHAVLSHPRLPALLCCTLPMADTDKAGAAAEKPRSTAEADITKYKTAADIVNSVVKKLVGLSVEGAKVLDLCIEGDKLIEEGTGAVYNKAPKGVKVPKGLAFPTSVSVNNCVAHFSPLASDPLSSQTLAKGDVVKIHIGAHIDGFAAITAETLVVGASEAEPVSGRRADVLRAAWTAAEAAMRLVKVGNKNWQVSDAVSKVAAAWDCKPVEGMLSCQQTQNVIDGKKRIILNPSEQQKRDFETVTFAENEVYGIDILISSGEDGKARLEESRTTIYQRDHTVTYQLKMKTSRAVFSEVQTKAGPFPFNVRVLEDEKRGRLGLQEAVQHSLVKPYEVIYTPSNTFVAGFHFTIALLAGGPSLLTHPPVWYKPELVKTEKDLEDEELKELLTKKLRETKKKNKKKAEGEGEAA